MFYITKFNYRRFISMLEIDIPSEYKRSFYREYKIPHITPKVKELLFDYEKRTLVMSHLLSLSPQNLFRMVFFIPEQISAYHSNPKCEAMLSDYKAINIPKEIEGDKIEQYRKFILSNTHKLEDLNFWRECKILHNLSEEPEMLRKHYSQVKIIPNSGVQQITEKLINSIKNNIQDIENIYDDYKIDLKKYSNNPFKILDNLIEQNRTEQNNFIRIMTNLKNNLITPSIKNL